MIKSNDRSSSSPNRGFLDNYDVVIEYFFRPNNLKVDVSFAEFSLATLDKIRETAGIALNPYSYDRAGYRRWHALRERGKAGNDQKQYQQASRHHFGSSPCRDKITGIGANAHMHARRVFIETSVALKIGTPHLPEERWQAIVRHLASTCRFVVSPLTFFEVLNSLACGDDDHFVPNLRRLRVLSPQDPAHPTFLEMPGQFSLRAIFGWGTIADTYKPEQLEWVMVHVLEQAAPTAKLRAWLADVNSQLRVGKDSFVSTYEELRRSCPTEPDRDLWARERLMQLGIVSPTSEESGRFSRGLDAAFAYEASTRRQLKNPSYSPAKDESSWVDPQQLFYLCDPDVHMLYFDKDFEIAEDTIQGSQLLNLRGVLEEIGANIV